MFQAQTDRVLDATMEFQRVEAAKIVEACSRLSEQEQRYTRKCIEQTDPLRLTPEAWHASQMKEPSFWFVAIVTSLFVAWRCRSRLYGWWLWALLAFTAAVFAGDLAFGYASYLLGPFQHWTVGNRPRVQVFAYLVIAVVAILALIIGVGISSVVARTSASVSRRGAIERIGLLAICLGLSTLAPALVLSLVDGSWSRQLAWLSGAYHAYGAGATSFGWLGLPAAFVIFGIVLSFVLRPVLGCISKWVAVGPQ